MTFPSEYDLIQMEQWARDLTQGIGFNRSASEIRQMVEDRAEQLQEDMRRLVAIVRKYREECIP